MGGFRFRLYARDGDDLGIREFSEPNRNVGDTVALRDRVYRVYRLVYVDDDGDVRGLLRLEKPVPFGRPPVTKREACTGVFACRARTADSAASLQDVGGLVRP